MPTVYVIHAVEDEHVVQEQILPHLAISGFDHWLSRHHLGGGAGETVETERLAEGMVGCECILAVATTALLGFDAAAQEIDTALGLKDRPVFVAHMGVPTQKQRARLPERLWSMPSVDLRPDSGPDAGLLVGDLLPSVDRSTRESEWPEGAERVPWDAGLFSASLGRATKRHDYAIAEVLVDTLTRHLRSQVGEYPSGPARDDLQSLQQERAFQLMRRYADAVLASGTSDARVRRHYAQALIEISDLDGALEVLDSILHDRAAPRDEVFEAHGLVGRVFKQRYVENPGDPLAAEHLRRAIESYYAVYHQDHQQFWHGVNAASCMLRAERDDVAYEPVGLARQIAARVDKDIARLADEGQLKVWDCASRVEALIALGRFEEAEEAVQAYISHPGMTAFEVTSTFRQCKQVLELGSRQEGGPVLDKLRRAMERYRSSSMLAPEAPAKRAAAESSEASDLRSLLIRLGDDRDLGDVIDLEVEARLGTVVTARGSSNSIRELLADPRVISVEESRPAGHVECERSVPFIGVAAHYGDALRAFEETGENALVAVIDNGIDVLQKAFIDANGNSRIVGIWDQSSSDGAPPPGFSYGVYHDEATIAGYLTNRSVPPSLGRDRDGHGTHVTSIAAGRKTDSFAGGVAPGSRILCVISSGSGPIGYSQSHVDALAFIERRATELKLPVVVNVSQGMNAGAHDGKSALEVAFTAFSLSGTRPGRAIVKSAGNERDKGGHAMFTVPPDSVEELRWLRPEGANRSDRIELWWSSADELEFRLREPNGHWSPWVGRTLPVYQATDTNGGTIRVSFTKLHPDNGDDQLLIELGDATTSAALGTWRLEATSHDSPDGGIVHGWIERGRGVATEFDNHADERMTISIPGTASSVIVVGAVDASKPLRVGDFSSYGPTRTGKLRPLVCAPGLEVNAAQSGVADGVIPLSGTSQAAPHVAGAIALLFSRAAKSPRIPNSNQVSAVLRRGRLSHSWDPGQGFGLVDVARLLDAFE